MLGDRDLFYSLASALAASGHMKQLPAKYLSKCAQSLSLVNCVQYGLLQQVGGPPSPNVQAHAHLPEAL